MGRVLLVTDGIVEATSAAGQRFGDQRLVELTERAAHDRLPLAELARGITRGVYDSRAGHLEERRSYSSSDTREAE